MFLEHEQRQTGNGNREVDPGELRWWEAREEQRIARRLNQGMGSHDAADEHARRVRRPTLVRPDLAKNIQERSPNP